MVKVKFGTRPFLAISPYGLMDILGGNIFCKSWSARRRTPCRMKLFAVPPQQERLERAPPRNREGHGRDFSRLEARHGGDRSLARRDPADSTAHNTGHIHNRWVRELLGTKATPLAPTGPSTKPPETARPPCLRRIYPERGSKPHHRHERAT